MGTCNRCGHSNPEATAVCLNCGYEVGAAYAAVPSPASRPWPLSALLIAVAVLAVATATAVVLSTRRGARPRRPSVTAPAAATPSHRGTSTAGSGPSGVPTRRPTGEDQLLSFRQVVPKYRALRRGNATYLRFRYTSGDGSTYICELPTQQAQGKQGRPAWEQMFQLYAVGGGGTGAERPGRAVEIDMGDQYARSRNHVYVGEPEAVRELARAIHRHREATRFTIRWVGVYPAEPELGDTSANRFPDAVTYDKQSSLLVHELGAWTGLGGTWGPTTYVYGGVTPEIIESLAEESKTTLVTVDSLTEHGCTQTVSP